MGDVATVAAPVGMELTKDGGYSKPEALPGYAHGDKAAEWGAPRTFPTGDGGEDQQCVSHEPTPPTPANKQVFEPPYQSTPQLYPKGGESKMKVLMDPDSKEKQTQQHRHRHQSLTRSRPLSSSHDRDGILSRTTSMAESLVDSWTPPTIASAAALGSTHKNLFAFDTTSYGVDLGAELDATEHSTLRLARPPSSRGILPSFEALNSLNREDGELTAKETGALREKVYAVSMAPSPGRLTPRAPPGRVGSSSFAKGIMGYNVGDLATSPSFGGGVKQPLSPVHSVVSSSSIGNKVHCLDDTGSPRGSIENKVVLGGPPTTIQVDSPAQSSRSSSSDATPRSSWESPRVPAAALADPFSPGSLSGEDDSSSETDREVIMSPPSVSAGVREAESKIEEEHDMPPLGTPTSSNARDSIRSTSTVLTEVEIFEEKSESPPAETAALRKEGQQEDDSIASSIGETGVALPPSVRIDCDPSAKEVIERARLTLPRGMAGSGSLSQNASASMASSEGDSITNNRISPFSTKNAASRKVAPSPNDPASASSSERGRITDNRVSRFSTKNSAVRKVTPSPDDPALVSSSEGDGITDNRISPLSTKNAAVWKVAPSPDDPASASSSEGDRITDNRISPLSTKNDAIWKVAPSPDDSAIASSSEGDGITDNRISPFSAENASIWELSSSPNDTASARSSEGDGVADTRISPFSIENASIWEVAAAADARARASDPTFRNTLVRGSSRSLVEDIKAMWNRSHSNAAAAGASNHDNSSKGGIFGAWRSLRQMNGIDQRARVESARVAPRPPVPHSVAPVASSPVKLQGDRVNAPGSYDGDLAEKGGVIAPFFGGPWPLGKTPLVSPFPLDLYKGDKDTSDEDTASSGTGSPSPGIARVKDEIEGGDLEEGHGEAERAAGVLEAVPTTPARVISEEAISRILATASEEETIVLPCPPTEQEKVLYYDSGRALLVTSAVLAFLTLSTGTWLFTIVHPAFYWFGVPSVFLMIYLGCHYFGVAVWGKDFAPDDHAEIIRESEQRGYEPTVDVFLPVCGEPAYLLANTWRHVFALDYPNFKVYVLDDGNKEEVKALAEVFGFNYIVRRDRPLLKKAGNLRHAFARTTADAIAIFDADFCPRPDFLKETVPYFGHDSSIGIVQTPQYFRYRKEQTWIEQGAGMTQEFFYRLVQVNQDRFHAAVCVGSCGLYRRAALEPFGGMAAIGHSEDMYTGFKMTEHGYRIKYVPVPLAMGTCPDEPQGFFMQQYRWAMGSATLVIEKEFWKSSISRVHKLCFLNGLLYYIATALMLFLTPVPFLMLVWINADEILWYHAGFTLPAILFAAVIMPLWSTQRYGMACHRVRVIQCYAHLYALKDRLMGRSAPWVPSGAGSSRGASRTFKSSMRLLVVWNVVTTILVVGGCIWRMTELTWYHFIPAMVITIGGSILSISTLFSC